MRIAIAGATGFVGGELISKWKSSQNFEIVALTRRDLGQISDNSRGQNIDWRKVDSYSLPELEDALKGCDTLIYLIHSMLPSATLLQGDFWEFDAYLADNFARAAKKVGIRRIVYLGGLIPESEKLSAHLESRREVESILRSYGVPLVVLRAGIVVGKGGSSFRIMERLVRRLPLMVCPSWTSTLSQPIDVTDVVKIFEEILSTATDQNQTYDIGGPEKISYEHMLRIVAQALGRSVRFLHVPFLSPWLSRLWVSTITGVPRSLVYPLVDSLRHEMVIQENNAYPANFQLQSFAQSLDSALGADRSQRFSVSGFLRQGLSFRIHKDVRSIQRMPNPQGMSARAAMEAYADWLPTFLKFIVSTRRIDKDVEFRLFSLVTVLRLTMSERSSADRCVLYVTGGLLVRKPVYGKGRLEFREILDGRYILCHLQDFRPALPWFIYKYSQALAHLFVLKKFEQSVINTKA